MFSLLRNASIILFVSTAIGIAVTASVYRAETERLRSEVEQELTSMIAEVSRSLTQGTSLLTATHAFLSTRTTDISRDRFYKYVRDLRLTGFSSGLHGVGIAAEVNDSNRYEIAMRLTRDYNESLAPWPNYKNARSSIVLLEPLNKLNKAALGFDMLSETRRAEAMSLAMNNPGTIYMTAPVRLVQERGDSAGFLLFLALDSEESGMPRGWLYSPLRADDLFQNAIQASRTWLEIRAYDAAYPEETIYQTNGFDPKREGLRAEQILSDGGRQWVIIGQSAKISHVFEKHPFTFITLALMAIIVITSTVAVHGVSQATIRARRLSEAQAQMMREKDLHLREMSHRIKNSLTRVAAMARQAARGSESKEEFVRSMNARLQAMANASDVLTRSSRGSADLRELLNVELDQIKGDHDVMPVTASGPNVHLNSRETQALGLCFHELATNSLKYGAGSLPGSRLDITWSIAASPKKGKYLLQLVWDEITHQPATPSESTGFGTQLLNNCVKAELSGDIRRNYHDQGLTIEIEVHLDRPN